MKKGKVPPKESETQLAPKAFPVRDGYEKRYVVDPTKTEHFTNWHTALGAKEALKTHHAKDDVRVRLRLRNDGWDLVVKVPKEVKKHGAHLASQEEVLQTQSATVASVAS